MPELKNVRIASVGVCTMASPRKLNDVFMMTGTPVRFPNSSISRQYSGLISFSTVCGRALPSTCVTEGITPRFSGSTCAVKIMNGESVALSRYSLAASFFNEGAKGRHHSRNFTALFTFAFISGSRGLHENLIDKARRRDLPISFRVQRHAASQAKIPAARFLHRHAHHAHHGQLAGVLHGIRDVLVPRVDLAFRRARRAQQRS